MIAYPNTEHGRPQAHHMAIAAGAGADIVFGVVAAFA
jgi:hypothetical protein